MAKKIPYEILYSDEHIIITHKSSGIPVIPGRNLETISLKQQLEKDLNQQIWVTHRIDKETSGLVLFAKDAEVHKLINSAFQEHKIQKRYLCISSGLVPANKQEVDKPIFVDSRSQKVKIHPKGKQSLSIYRGLENTNRFSLVEVTIKTGRMHQVRVHLASEGFPIVGDQLYNKSPDIYLHDIKKKFNAGKAIEKRPLIQRCALHAIGLAFEHPITKESIEVSADYPKDIRACWNQLTKHDV